LRDIVFPLELPINEEETKSYDEYIEHQIDMFSDWINGIVECKEKLSEEDFKELFTKTQLILSSYEKALDINIIIDSVEKYNSYFTDEDRETIYGLPDKHLSKK